MFFVPSVHGVHILQWGVIMENSSVDIDIFIQYLLKAKIIEPVHEQQCGLCASKASDQPAHTRSLIRAFASRLTIL